jgi:hypothetical protein
MPHPLPADVVALLSTDRTAASVAALILVASHRDIVAWALDAFPAKPNGAERPARTNDKGKHLSPQQAAAQADEALLAMMQANPGASLAELIAFAGRPRMAVRRALIRLEEAGHVEHLGRGVYAAVDPDAGLVEGPPSARPEGAAWVAPLSARHRARHSSTGAVRDELTMA